MRNFYFILLILILLTLNSIFGQGPFAWGVGFLYVGYDTALLLFVSIQMLKVMKEQKERVPMPESFPTLAVLITARNEASVLNACIEALDAQTIKADQIFWIDDGSTDQSLLLLQSLNAHRSHPLLVHAKMHSGKASSLNEVWPNVNAEVLVTLDADTLLEKEALAEIRFTFAINKNLMATGGILTPKSIQKPGSFFELFQRFEYIRSFLSRRAWMSKGSLLLVSGAFAAYRKQVLIEVGGYDPQSYVEDYDLIHRIHRYSFEQGKHHEVQVTVSARASTDVPGTLKQFLRQRRRWFAGFLQTQFKNADMIGNRKYGPVGTFMLMIKSADTLQPIFGLIALITLGFFFFSSRPFPALVWKVLLAKIILDFFFHYASIALYYRWQQKPVQSKTWFLSTLATFLEPVSFQIFRHTGALYGWIAYLTQRSDWSPQRVSSVAKSDTPVHPQENSISD